MQLPQMNMGVGEKGGEGEVHDKNEDKSQTWLRETVFCNYWCALPSFKIQFKMQGSWIQSVCPLHLATDEADSHLTTPETLTPCEGWSGSFSVWSCKGAGNQAGTGHVAPTATFRVDAWWAVLNVCCCSWRPSVMKYTGCVLGWFTANLVDLCSTLWNVNFSI